jgi:hypothetical protein
MTVADTSRRAYETVDLSDRQRQVMDAIADLGEASDLEISGELHWPINCVTPRRGELVEIGLVVKSREKLGPSGRMCSVWRPAVRQLDLFGMEGFYPERQ